MEAVLGPIGEAVLEPIVSGNFTRCFGTNLSLTRGVEAVLGQIVEAVLGPIVSGNFTRCFGTTATTTTSSRSQSPRWLQQKESMIYG